MHRKPSMKKTWTIGQGFALLLAGLLAATAATANDTLTWTGDGANAYASTPENWDLEREPVAGDHVILDDAHLDNPQPNVTWDLDIALSSWEQTANYEGRVTIQTRYPGVDGEGTTFTNLTVTGNVVIENGVWTHPANSGGEDPHDRLAVSVGGDFTLGENALIDLYRRGFAAQSGPGAGGDRSVNEPGGSHGGRGSAGPDVIPSPCYGSVLRPESLGSGSRREGGGALRLEVTGQSQIEGTIRAQGNDGGNTGNGSAGGSIWITTGTLVGNGELRVNGGGGGRATGGGGRIAIHLTDSDDFGDITYATRGGGDNSAAGTLVLLPSEGPGRLIIDNQSRSLIAYTELPPSYEEPETHPAIGGELEDLELVITNSTQVLLTESLRMQDFTYLGSQAVIDLDNNILFLKADEPVDDFPEDYGNGAVIYGYGDIIWGDAEAAMPLTIEDADHGSVVRDPEEPDNLYPIDSEVTVTANPDSGYNFAMWLGDVPEAEDPTDNPLMVTMNRGRHLIPVFLADATHAWTGLGEDFLASNPMNWAPQTTPTSGVHIVFGDYGDYSSSSCQWDLGIDLASWTQTGDYEGVVTIQTKYYEADGFTNLAVAGDVIIENGVWTHPANSGGDDPVDRLAVSVGGDFTLGENAMIDLKYRGFADESGPGAGGSRSDDAPGASHGGRGGIMDRDPPVEFASCYGSLMRPVTLGSGGRNRGAGALLLKVNGHSQIDGDIDARGDLSAGSSGAGSAGGSIWITTATLAGNGELRAGGGAGGRQSGGGGRIAIHLTDSDDFNEITYDARGGASGARGAAGTIVLLPAEGQGLLLVDNTNIETTFDAYTELPAGLESEGDIAGLHELALRIQNHARIGIMEPDMRVFDVEWIDADSQLHLQGHDLYVRTPYHPFSESEAAEALVVDDALGGELIWMQRGTLFLLQ